jgi:hypothetical protein
MTVISEEGQIRNMEDDKKDPIGIQSDSDSLMREVIGVEPCTDPKVHSLEAGLGLDGEDRQQIPWLHRLSPYIISMCLASTACLCNDLAHLYRSTDLGEFKVWPFVTGGTLTCYM